MSVTAAPLSVLDELFLHLDTPDEPWSVHMEIGVERRLDADRLTHAVHEALAWHPRSRERVPVCSASARDLTSRRRSRSPWLVADRALKVRATLEMLAEAGGAPARIAADGATVANGYGFERFELGDGELDQVIAGRESGQTVNDVLLAALGLTIDRWNLDRDQPTGRIAFMMPVNLRPAAWASSVVSNLASYVTISRHEAERQTLAGAVRAVARRTRRVKSARTDGLLIDVLGLPSLLPVGIRRRMPSLISIVESRLVDTVVLSNLGRLAAPQPMGDAGQVRSVWFSPPARMPLGAAIGVATMSGRMFVTLRYRHALLDADAARRFATLYRETLIGGT